jgi:hypothetical protein
MFLVAIICMIAFCVLIFLFLRNFGNMKPIPVMAVAIAVYLLGKTPFFLLSCFPGALLLLWPPGSETICYDQDLPEEGKQMLKGCFGEDSVISEGVEKEYSYFNEHDQINVTIHYTEWTLSYQDARGQRSLFVFDNRWPEFDNSSIEKDVERYFSRQTEEFYQKNFWDKTLAGISGIREDDSMLYLQEYSDSDLRNMPEASDMVERMQRYSLAENIYFPELQYEEVFKSFPYILEMYLYVDYESDGEEERSRQRQETERKLRQMIGEMISCTDHSLNATVGVTMMDENGYADSFRLAVLEGEYFTGRGRDFDIALFEGFFGDMDGDP